MRACGLFLILLSAGCEKPARPQVFVVAGTLTADEKPAANASIAFHPVAAARTLPFRPVAVTRPDGSYQLTTSTSGDGAPPGEYVVTVVWPNPAEPYDDCQCLDFNKHDLFRGRYANPATSTLRAVVHPRRNEILLQTTVEEDEERKG